MFQLASLLSTLIWSGIGLTENLRLCEKTIRNRFLRNQFRGARALVNEGKSLPEALRKFKFMPLMQLDVIEVGEKTGNLGNSMEDAGESFSGAIIEENKNHDHPCIWGSTWLCFHFSCFSSHIYCN